MATFVILFGCTLTVLSSQAMTSSLFVIDDSCIKLFKYLYIYF